jgi:hypothetical protein
MNKKPDFWNDQDELSIARRARLHQRLKDVVDDCVKKRPEPKDLPTDTPSKSSPINSTIHAGKVFQFSDYQSEQARQNSMFRGYGRHRARNWRLMQERDEKRKRQEDEQTDQ